MKTVCSLISPVLAFLTLNKDLVQWCDLLFAFFLRKLCGLGVFVFTIKLKLEFEEPVYDRAYMAKARQPDSEKAFKGFFVRRLGP